MDSQARITAIAGPGRALYIFYLIARLQKDAARGATWTRLADRLVAEDTGLSHDQVQRARQWWAALGVIICHTRGIPPTIEYDIAATLSAWEAWLEANHINYAPARNQLRASASSFTRQRVKLYAPARPLDHDHDDDDRHTIAIKRQITEAEAAARQLGLDVDQLKEECNAYQPKYPDRYYLAALRQRIAQAQSPLPLHQPPRPARPTRRHTFRRRQVEYTEAQRRAVEERARQLLERERQLQAYLE